MFKRNKVRRSPEFNKRMDRNALIATFGGAAMGVAAGYGFNEVAGAGIGFYVGGLVSGGFNRLVIEPLNKYYYDWCVAEKQKANDNKPNGDALDLDKSDEPDEPDNSPSP